MNFIKRFNNILNDIGFEIEPFGDNTSLITAIPPNFPMDNISGMISDIINDLINSNESSKKIDKNAIAGAACKLAVKAHDSLSILEAEELVRQLSRCELPFTCPHGRPTVINISFKELEKRFGRRT